MDGGVDAAITLYFGTQLQKRVQQYIIENFGKGGGRGGRGGREGEV